MHSVMSNYIKTQYGKEYNVGLFVQKAFVQKAIEKRPKPRHWTNREVQKCMSYIGRCLTRVFSCFLHREHHKTLSLSCKVPQLAPTTFTIVLCLQCDIKGSMMYTNSLI